MKEIKLKELTLTNFKGEKSRKVFFGEQQTDIYGDNGAGKSRLFDAFLWLLFGKDSKDRKDFMIRSVDEEGYPLFRVECSVAGVLSVDGQDMRLKRVYKDNWVKPRGQAEEVFKGNITECYIDDMPVKVTDYQQEVSSIIDETVFKMITNNTFFVNIDWKQQREQLFLMAGEVSDEDIAEGDDDFEKILEEISGKGLDEYRKQLYSKKKLLKEELKDIEPKIEQTQKMCPEQKDFALIREDIKLLDEQMRDIDLQLTSSNARLEAQDKQRREQQQAIEEKKEQCRAMLIKEQLAEDERCIKANAEIRKQAALLQGQESDIAAQNRELYKYQAQQKELQGEIIKADQQLEQLRSEYKQVYKEQMNEGDNYCPTCHQVLPPQMINHKQELFTQHKQERLQAINDKGGQISKDKQAKVLEIEVLQNKEQETRKSIEQLQAEIDKSKDYLSKNKEEKPKMLSIYDVEQCAEMSKQIKDMEQALAQKHNDNKDNKEDSLISSLQTRKRELTKERDEKITLLADEKKIEQCKEEINALNSQAKNIAQEIAFLEKQEYTSKLFLEKKIKANEQRINSLFTQVTFKLFDYTLEGNSVECCVPMIKGVKFFASNTASQINAGLDIINALCNYYKVQAPIFIDNRESVNNIISTRSQIINLVVSKDKELRIEAR